ncbi:sarcosine oxidase/N-methyl-L-tryptophan oxidase [Evansella vedderi]|uniref:Sarcosine oxidase/N-methyl-L-tryptophan oxidase n=1 Tax=Evansella vedderi TaxID=38282 RepID=A0ABT9ZUE9_9BACI|nr:N-methyl-L-tryptophan oxidase [Evansella vedderi]MDQ0254868.1 sarcosine oxidase/N-methyl-L-tryptophan oxidase [Evansella vedderi]
MNKFYDCIIIGAGSMGSAAGYFLAKQGLQTLLIDAFDPPHTYGSHHGDTRIIRHAYGEGSNYVPLALRSQQLWKELEHEANRKLFEQTGVLCVGENNSSFIKEIEKSAHKYELPIELLDKKEISYRWKGMTPPEGYVGTFEPTSGVLYSEHCIREYVKLAARYGGEILSNTSVEKIEVNEGNIKVQTKAQTFHGQKLIITAGAWGKKLFAQTGIDLPLTPTRKTVAWFNSEEKLFSADQFPAYSYTLPTGTYYGFPSFRGSGVKVGRHDGGDSVDPDNINREFGAFPEDEGDLRSFLETNMPEAAGSLKKGSVCMYTLTPDEHFIVDHHPHNKNVIIAAGFSGHGFKFASGIGEALSQMVTKQDTYIDMSMFSINRF